MPTEDQRNPNFRKRKRGKAPKRIDTSQLDTWQGRKQFRVNTKVWWQWDPDQSSYFLNSRRIAKSGFESTVQGIRSTFFAAQGIYVKPEFQSITAFENFFSNQPELLGRRLFRGNDDRAIQRIKPSDFDGEVPFSFLVEKLNDLLVDPRAFRREFPNARSVPDFRKMYEKWSYRYEVVNAVNVYDRDGTKRLKVVREKGKTKSASKGM